VRQLAREIHRNAEAGTLNPASYGGQGASSLGGRVASRPLLVAVILAMALLLLLTALRLAGLFPRPENCYFPPCY